MAQDNDIKPIAEARLGDEATVRVLSIMYDATLTCDRDCSMLKTSFDGTIKCALNRVEGISNFQTKALLVDYEVVLDRDATEEWQVFESFFKIIDSEGHIHTGNCLCESLSAPEKYGTIRSDHTLYSGTRMTLRICYRDVPSDAKVVSVIVERNHEIKTRVYLDPETTYVAPPQESAGRLVFNPRNPGDLFDRIDRLEEALRDLQEKLAKLSGYNETEYKPSIEIPVTPEKTVEPTIAVSSVMELRALDPVKFRDTMIHMLHCQGFKNIEILTEPDVGFGSMTGSRFGTRYAIYTVHGHNSKSITDVKMVQWLIRFKKRRNAEKAIYITSGKLSREAEIEAISNGIEILDIDRISILLSLKNDSFGYQPLKN